MAGMASSTAAAGGMGGMGGMDMGGGCKISVSNLPILLSIPCLS
jgi:hypothetical protein